MPSYLDRPTRVQLKLDQRLACLASTRAGRVVGGVRLGRGRGRAEPLASAADAHSLPFLPIKAVGGVGQATCLVSGWPFLSPIRFAALASSLASITAHSRKQDNLMKRADTHMTPSASNPVHASTGEAATPVLAVDIARPMVGPPLPAPADGSGAWVGRAWRLSGWPLSRWRCWLRWWSACSRQSSAAPGPAFACATPTVFVAQGSGSTQLGGGERRHLGGLVLRRFIGVRHVGPRTTRSGFDPLEQLHATAIPRPPAICWRRSTMAAPYDPDGSTEPWAAGIRRGRRSTPAATTTT